MHIGIMSDSHGDAKRTASAIKRIRKYKPVHIIHCGDICSQSVVTELEAGFADPEVPVTCVLGNCDVRGRLSPALSNVTIEGRFAEKKISGKRIAVIHGDDLSALDSVCTSGKYDYVFTGHTHVKSDDRVNNTRVINPGALYRAREYTCAVLNLDTDVLTYMELK